MDKKQLVITNGFLMILNLGIAIATNPPRFVEGLLFFAAGCTFCSAMWVLQS